MNRSGGYPGAQSHSLSSCRAVIESATVTSYDSQLPLIDDHKLPDESCSPIEAQAPVTMPAAMPSDVLPNTLSDALAFVGLQADMAPRKLAGWTSAVRVLQRVTG